MAIENTGYKAYQNLEQYNLSTGVATGTIKPNVSTDQDYIAPEVDLDSCPVTEENIVTENTIQVQIQNTGGQFIAFNTLTIYPYNAESLAQYWYNSNYSTIPGKTENLLNPTVQQIGDWFNISITSGSFSKALTLKVEVYFTNSLGRSLKKTFNVNPNTSSSQTLINIPRAASHINLIELVLSDIAGSTPTPNQPPVANAGVDQSLVLTSDPDAIDYVQLAGTATDSDGTIIKYNWSQVSGPVTYNISDPTIANPRISFQGAGIYVFKFTATDNLGATGSDTITITVSSESISTNGLVVLLVDSSLTSSAITELNLYSGVDKTSYLTSSVTSSNSPRTLIVPKGTYDVEVVTAGSGSSVRSTVGSTTTCQPYSGPRSYVFFAQEIGEGVNGLAVSLTSGVCGVTSIYVRLTFGTASTYEEATTPWGKKIITSRTITAQFYSDSAGTIPISVSLVLNYRVVVVDSVTGNTSVINSYTSVVSQNSIVLGGTTQLQVYDYTQNNPALIEPSDLVQNSTYTYTLLPGAGYIII